MNELTSEDQRVMSIEMERTGDRVKKKLQQNNGFLNFSKDGEKKN